ncbi:MAG: polysaccharide deacetylase family protein [Anaerolineales bacterium]
MQKSPVAAAPAASAVILLYHRVGTIDPRLSHLGVSPEHFEEQLLVLLKAFVPIRLQELLEGLARGVLQDRSVVLTFDDGYADNFTRVLPLLKRYSVPATVFVATGYLDGKREFWWDALQRIVFDAAGDPSQWSLGWVTSKGLPLAWPKGTPREGILRDLHEALQFMDPGTIEAHLAQLSDLARVEPKVRSSVRPMTAGECAALAADGLVEIGAHTVNHPWMANLSAEAQKREMEDSRAALEELLPVPVRYLAYPYGRPDSVTADTLRLAREAGFQAACALVRNCVTIGADPFWLPRCHPHDLGGEDFLRRMESTFKKFGASTRSTGPRAAASRTGGKLSLHVLARGILRRTGIRRKASSKRRPPRALPT